ncbi:hypothetical protein TKK_0002896 [Trichogramma kaykai]
MQFPVSDECKDSLTIVTQKGLYRYTKVPEGVSPAPAYVQKKMDECLRGCEGVIAYIDNIYVTGRSYEEHKKNLEQVCKQLPESGQRLNVTKCSFMQERIKVLGFVKNGLHKAKSKVNAMINGPQPTNKKDSALFLGLVNFYA